MLRKIELNNDLRALIHRVREDRKYHSLCVSAQDNIDVPTLLEQIIKTECYKKDYEQYTLTMLYAPCSYEEAITGLKKLIDSDAFGKDEEYENNTIHISIPSKAKIVSYKTYKVFMMPKNCLYANYTYKISNEFISINRNEKTIVFHLPKNYLFKLENHEINKTIELTMMEYVVEIKDKDESAYNIKVVQCS